jgi:hypothetical protein
MNIKVLLLCGVEVLLNASIMVQDRQNDIIAG